MSRPWSPHAKALRDHIELAHIALTAHQLELLIAVLTEVHSRDTQQPSTDQARSIVRVARVMLRLLDAYQALLTLPEVRQHPHR